jgi:outer membrane protein assembly factor BamB
MLPVHWSESKNVAWKRAIHARGWSSPVIWGQQIWLTTATPDGKQMFALCIDKESGQILHDVKLFDVAEPREIHVTNTYASPTPVIEDGRVYVHFGSYGTACLDTVTAKILWTRRNLPCNHWRGPASSPIVFENLLIMHFDGYDYQYVVALDKRTGRTVWKEDRNVDYGTDDGDVMKAYCTPIIIQAAGRLQLISPTSKAAISYNPRTGEELWKVRFEQFSATARPLYGHGLLFINTGFGKANLLAVRPDGTGDVTATHVVWTVKKSVPSKPSQLLVGDLLYMVHDAGVATCLEAKTGQLVWQQRIGGKYSSSPLQAGGRIYFFSHDGKTTVVAAGREYRLVAVNQLGAQPGDGFRASPAVSGNALFLRNLTHLYRIQQTSPSTRP